MRLPSVLMMCMCLLDVVFNALLLFPDGAFCIGSLPIPRFDLGVRGAAIGTGLSQLTVDSVLLFQLLFRSPSLCLHRGEKFQFSFFQLKKSAHILACYGGVGRHDQRPRGNNGSRCAIGHRCRGG